MHPLRSGIGCHETLAWLYDGSIELDDSPLAVVRSPPQRTTARYKELANARQNQRNLIRSLKDPSVYPHETDQLQLIETHISWVFLSGVYAYKIKRRSTSGSSISRRWINGNSIVKRNCVSMAGSHPSYTWRLFRLPAHRTIRNWGDRVKAFEYAVKMRRFRSRHC